ncbi:13230_t:CDS:2, partial [Racocetra persica]
IQLYHNSDQVVLKALEYSVNGQNLVAINFYIPREYAISEARIALTKEINKKINTLAIYNEYSNNRIEPKDNNSDDNNSENSLKAINNNNILEL